MAKTSMVWIVAFLATTHSVLAQELCISPVGQSPEVVFQKNGPYFTAKVETVREFGFPFIDGVAAPILTISDRTLRIFKDPPLDQWNRILPGIATQSDGTTWAYTIVKPALYRLSNGRFVRDPISDFPGLIGFASSNERRWYEDRSSPIPAEGPIIALTKDGIAFVENGELEEISLPRGWRYTDPAPFHVPEVGWFLPVNGTIWFRQFDNAQWHATAKIRDIRSIYGGSPFSRFQVRHIAETGEIWLMLADRVMVGHFNKDDAAPKFDYQFSGDIVIHQPTGQVLVWSGKPWSKSASDWPKKLPEVPGLWEMTLGKPTLVTGFAAKARMASTGSVPLPENIFHPASGLTLIGHETGFASFDGHRLRDMPQLASKDDGFVYLDRVGGRIIARTHNWLAEITDDLNVRPIPIPMDQPKGPRLTYSEGLGRFFLYCRNCNSVFESKDLKSFQTVKGANEPIKVIPGDMPDGKATIALSKTKAYLIEHCDS